MKFFNSGVVPAFLRYGLTAAFVLAFALNLQAQISGDVFRDYNGNGSRDNTPTVHRVANSSNVTSTAYKPGYVEPIVAGVVVTAYGNNDVVLASFISTGSTSPNYTIPVSGTTYTGVKGSNTGFVPNGTPVRLEFTFTTDGGYLPNAAFDFTSKRGKVYGSSVRFLAASSGARTGYNFAFNNPKDNISGSGETPATDTYLFQAVQFAGNGTSSSGTSLTQNTIVRFPYKRDANPNLTTPTGIAPESLTTASQTGSIYGLTYSKQAGKLFASAYLKRHSGFGPVSSGGTFNDTPGAIYMVNPTTKAVSVLASLDALGYPTHNYANGAPTYGSAQHYTLTNNNVTNDNQGTRTETITYTEAGLGVIGSNSQRSLPNNINTPSNDAAAFGQVGRVSLGEIELSDDGKYLFVVNLYDRKVYQLQLNSVTNPTSASYVNSWLLPNPPARSASGLSGAATTYATSATINDFYNGVRGLQRPFALKYYRGKLYVGATTTGEGTGATSTTDNNSGNVEYTDLWAYVWELTPSQGFQKTSPVLQFPLNYARGTNADSFDERWRSWTNTIQPGTIYLAAKSWGFPQAIMADIEFDDRDGSMILGFRDRTGDQGGYANYMLQNTSFSRTAVSYGDQLRAYRHVKTDPGNSAGFVAEYQIESNGKEGPGSSKAAIVAAQNSQGPGGGEFYYQDGLERYNGISNSTTQPHLNTAMGGLALLPGMEEVTSVYMDPLSLWSGGVSWMNNVTGANTRDYQIYGATSAGGVPSAGSIGKANGLGDIELLTVASTSLEIGNRVWQDTNADGIQSADEPGIGGVLLELVDAVGTVIATVTTATDGTWYFTNDTGTDETSVKYGVDLLPSTSYTVRLATSGIGNDWDPDVNAGAGGPRSDGALFGLSLTKANETGNGEEDLSDSDAELVDKVPSITFTTGGYGENNHTFDIGFVPYGSIGDYVWYDTNYNGAQDGGELPASGVAVTLWKSTDAGTTWNENFATTTTDASGYYHFGELLAATYKVVFAKPEGYEFTKQNQAPATDEADSDVNALGESQNVTIDVSLAEDNIGRNNPTIDAGLIAYGSIGDYVWFDENKNGKQDDAESPVENVIVNLWKWVESAWVKDFATTKTDVDGKYLFDNLETGTYKVEFVEPETYDFTHFQYSGTLAAEYSDAGEDGLSDDISIDATLAVEDIGRNNRTIDAGIVPEGSLPVILTTFKAKASEEKTVNLTWTTTSETNSAYFEVQKSATGKSWSAVGTVDAKGESRINQSYNFTDTAPLNGQNFYRLKLVDRDGTFGYSKLESVVLKGIISVNVYPNPTIDNFRIATASGIEVVEVSIYSGVGRLVMEIKNPAEGKIDIKHLSQGAYVVKIVTKDGAIETRKLILRK